MIFSKFCNARKDTAIFQTRFTCVCKIGPFLSASHISETMRLSSWEPHPQSPNHPISLPSHSQLCNDMVGGVEKPVHGHFSAPSATNSSSIGDELQFYQGRTVVHRATNRSSSADERLKGCGALGNRRWRLFNKTSLFALRSGKTADRIRGRDIGDLYHSRVSHSTSNRSGISSMMRKRSATVSARSIATRVCLKSLMPLKREVAAR